MDNSEEAIEMINQRDSDLEAGMATPPRREKRKKRMLIVAYLALVVSVILAIGGIVFIGYIIVSDIQPTVQPPTDKPTTPTIKQVETVRTTDLEHPTVQSPANNRTITSSETPATSTTEQVETVFTSSPTKEKQDELFSTYKHEVGSSTTQYSSTIPQHVESMQMDAAALVVSAQCQVETIEYPTGIKTTWKANESNSHCEVTIKGKKDDVNFYFRSAQNKVTFINPMDGSNISVPLEYPEKMYIMPNQDVRVSLDNNETVEFYEHFRRLPQATFGMCDRLVKIKTEKDVIEEKEQRCVIDYVRYHLWSEGPYIRKKFEESMEVFLKDERFKPAEVQLQSRCFNNVRC